ncbi:MAG: sodium-dependent transporter [Oscillospiraceae bacterium]|nr:sodium-dependent transporter [Oscillospiraceae bacterium]
MENNRGSFGSNLGFILAAVGSAVGLGNIWGFPYKMGLNGGFAFLLIYLVLAIFVGLAVMIGELAIGRKTGMSPVAAYRKLSKKFTWMGYMAVIVPFLILCFYFVLGGMVMRYALSYLTAIFGWDTWGVPVTEFFGTFICNGASVVIWTAIFIALNAFIVAAGVAGGIEKFCKIGMPALFVMLLAVIIYVAVQPGAMDGYKFMFGWNIEPLKTDFLGVLKAAAGQMFFSLSLGMGAMITYGSYLQKKESIQKNAVIIIVCDTLVAIMAGMIVMPACAAFLNGEYGGGPGLLFASMQQVFFNMGYVGNIIGFLFYGLVFIAAISSSMSLLEVITSFKVDQNIEAGKAPGRKKYAIIAAVIIFVFCLPVALDALGTGVEKGAPIAYPAELFGIEVKGWNDCWLDFYDMLSEGIMMPLGAMVMAFMIGWIWKIDMVVEECELSGHKFWGKTFFDICYKIITPIGMAFVLYAQIMTFFG